MSNLWAVSRVVKCLTRQYFHDYGCICAVIFVYCGRLEALGSYSHLYGLRRIWANKYYFFVLLFSICFKVHFAVLIYFALKKFCTVSSRFLNFFSWNSRMTLVLRWSWIFWNNNYHIWLCTCIWGLSAEDFLSSILAWVITLIPLFFVFV